MSVDKERERKKKYRQENKEKLKEYHKKWWIKNREKVKIQRELTGYRKKYYEKHKEVEKQKRREYHQKNKTKEKEYMLQYRKNNKDRIDQKSKEYWEEHREEIRLQRKTYHRSEQGRFVFSKHNQKRRALGKNLQNTLTLEEWKEIIQKQNNRCIVCDREFGEHLKPTKDHIIPLSKSSDLGLTKENTQAVCQSCNSAKRDKIFTKEEYDRWVQKRRAKYAIILKENE